MALREGSVQAVMVVRLVPPMLPLGQPRMTTSPGARADAKESMQREHAHRCTASETDGSDGAGHSLGGLLRRWALAGEGCPAHIARLVGREGTSPMHRTAIVPKDQITELPFVSIHELCLRSVFN
jgi:hypothetical protein